jgi:hypothetical protein
VDSNVMHQFKKGNELRAPGLSSDGLYPQSKKSDSSVRNLALAILLQAFRDVIAPKKSSNKEWAIWRQDALIWFFSEEMHPGSFYWVCEVLQMDPWDLRAWLQTYKRSDGKSKKEMVKKLIRFQIPH